MLNLLVHYQLILFIWPYYFAGFTGIDDPYEPPLSCEVCLYLGMETNCGRVLMNVELYQMWNIIKSQAGLLLCCAFVLCVSNWIILLAFQIEIQQKDGVCAAPGAMAGQVVSYLEEKGYLQCQWSTTLQLMFVWSLVIDYSKYIGCHFKHMVGCFNTPSGYE